VTIDRLDQVPQVPADYANHVIYGGALGLVCWGAATVLDLPAPALTSTAAVLAVAAIKKTFDYFNESESLAMCVGKAIVTAVWPATFVLVGA
jgi:hypothetical protein